MGGRSGLAGPPRVGGGGGCKTAPCAYPWGEPQGRFCLFIIIGIIWLGEIRGCVAPAAAPDFPETNNVGSDYDK